MKIALVFLMFVSGCSSALTIENTTDLGADGGADLQ